MKIYGKFPRAKLCRPPNCSASSICSDINSVMTIHGERDLIRPAYLKTDCGAR